MFSLLGQKETREDWQDVTFFSFDLKHARLPFDLTQMCQPFNILCRLSYVMVQLTRHMTCEDSRIVTQTWIM